MKLDKILKEIALIEQKDLYTKDFLLTWEKSETDIRLMLLVAECLKELRASNISPKVFESGLAVSLFRDNSTRTRFSFASAANLLGLAVQDLDETKSQIAHGETVRETANMISFLSDFVGIRDDIYPGLGHTYMKEFGAALDDGYNNGVLPVRPGIINLQCDVDHPTQSLSDLLHLKSHFGDLNQLKGKKICMSWAYSPSYGKPMSVPQGIIGLMSRMGMDITLAHPPGYDLMPDVVNVAKQQSIESEGSFEIMDDMRSAMEGADIVYPKSWAPMHIMDERTIRFNSGNAQGLKDLEKEGLAYNEKHRDWHYDADKMAITKNANALYMHCLPADISGVSCQHGEVSAEVFEKFRIPTYLEASWKPYVIAAMMFVNKFESVGDVLSSIYSNNSQRNLY